MSFPPRTALLTLSTLLLPACVPSVIVGDQPQDSATAPGTSETPPDTATATTVTPTTAAPGPTTHETDPASTADTAVSATADTTSTATIGPTSDTAGTTTTEGLSGTDVSTTPDPSDGTTTGPKQDLPPTDALVGCPLDAPPGTLVQGPTFFGQFSSQRAYFGWIGVVDPFSPRIVLLSPGADPATEFPEPTGNSGLVLEHWVSTDTPLEDGWLGTWETTAMIHENEMTSVPREPDTVKITELAGNWDTHDPADPPRLVGTIEGPISGPFDAVFCDKLVAFIIPE